MPWVLRDCTRTLLAEIAGPFTRADVAQTYKMALASDEETDWAAVDRAIVRKWCRNALEQIKREAGQCQVP